MTKDAIHLMLRKSHRDLVFANSKSGSVKFSKRGVSKEKLEILKDVAGKGGYNVGVVYHGTKTHERFRTFKDMHPDRGYFYFSFNESEAANFALFGTSGQGRVIPAFLKADNTFNVSTKGDIDAILNTDTAKKYFENFVDRQWKIDELSKELEEVEGEHGKNSEEAKDVKEELEKTKTRARLNRRYKMYQLKNYGWQIIANLDGRGALRSLGYDSHVEKEVYYETEIPYWIESEADLDAWMRETYDEKNAKAPDNIVVYSSKQIKSAELVTYDEEGKPIPPERRFDETIDDIYFSMRGDADMEVVDELTEKFDEGIEIIEDKEDIRVLEFPGMMMVLDDTQFEFTMNYISDKTGFPNAEWANEFGTGTHRVEQFIKEQVESGDLSMEGIDASEFYSTLKEVIKEVTVFDNYSHEVALVKRDAKLVAASIMETVDSMGADMNAETYSEFVLGKIYGGAEVKTMQEVINNFENKPKASIRNMLFAWRNLEQFHSHRAARGAISFDAKQESTGSGASIVADKIGKKNSQLMLEDVKQEADKYNWCIDV
jgi:hypothetical protein